MKGYRKKTKLDDFINREQGFTLIKCPKCGEFYDKHDRHGNSHICRERNSMPLCTRLINCEDDQ